MNKELLDSVKYGDMYCPYCFKRFSPKKVPGSISLEEQARTEQTLIQHLDDNYTKAFQNFSKIMGKVASDITNLHNTITVEQCTKARELYPTSHIVTISNTNISFNPLDLALHACKEAEK